MRLSKTLLALTAALSAVTLRGQQPASLDSTQLLPVVEVVAPVVHRQVIPSQRLGGDELKRLGGHSVADALKYFAGVQIKDYGGVGGIKTVNIRSMGSHHTGVFYDGIELSNAQNGQVDLGMYSLDNLGEISLYNGQKSEIFQPAKDFGAAGSIYLRSRRPMLVERGASHLRATLRGGSFDLVNPALLCEHRFTSRLTGSLNAEYLKSSGKYKFTYRRTAADGTVAYDTTATRQNGDIESVRVDGNLYGTFDDGEWNVKGYTYHSQRGIPGAIVSNVWRRGERVWDGNSFVQGHYQQSWGRFSLQGNGKYGFYRTRYLNNDETQLQVDNRYEQHEAYLSATALYKLNSAWDVSCAYDAQYNRMWADLHAFAMPRRLTQMAALATAFAAGRLKGQASLLLTAVADRNRQQAGTARRRRLTPALFLACTPAPELPLTLRAFYKESFRMPTFNDLYYADMGNSLLSPERVRQCDVGAEWSLHREQGLLRTLSLKADGYYNYVKDKIICYPKGQQFRWTMLNLGRTDIWGLDVLATLAAQPLRELRLTAKAQYTWQRAVDITDAGDSYYRHQIPYVPHHSGSLVLQGDWRHYSLNYSFTYVGERYNQQENILYNYMQPWYTSDLSLAARFRWGGCGGRVMAECNNLLDQSYDVILNYPMPGRNWRVTLTIEI